MSDLLKQLENNLELHEFPDLRTTGLELLEKIRTEAVSLQEDSDFLLALEDAGVDNWDGYSIAFRATNGDNQPE